METKNKTYTVYVPMTMVKVVSFTGVEAASEEEAAALFKAQIAEQMKGRGAYYGSDIVVNETLYSMDDDGCCDHWHMLEDDLIHIHAEENEDEDE